jgi:hypothetical protein
MATGVFTRKQIANAEKRKKCGISKCPKEVKVLNVSRRIAEKEVAKKCDKAACKNFYPCVSKMKPVNLTKKRTKAQFKKVYKDLQNKITKDCDPEKECQKSQKCSRKIYKESGFSKALIDLFDCKMKKCQSI